MSKKKMTLKEALDRVLCAVDYEIEGYRLNPGESDDQIRELQMAAQRVYDFWSKAAQAATPNYYEETIQAARALKDLK